MPGMQTCTIGWWGILTSLGIQQDCPFPTEAIHTPLAQRFRSILIKNEVPFGVPQHPRGVYIASRICQLNKELLPFLSGVREVDHVAPRNIAEWSYVTNLDQNSTLGVSAK